MTDEQDNIRDDFSPLLDGELDPERRAAIEKQLAEDGDLLRELESLQRVDELYRDMPRESAPSDLERRVRAELEPAPVRFRRRGAPRLSLWPSLAAVAMFLVFGALTWQLQKGNIPEHRQIASAPQKEVIASEQTDAERRVGGSADTPGKRGVPSPSRRGRASSEPLMMKQPDKTKREAPVIEMESPETSDSEGMMADALSEETPSDQIPGKQAEADALFGAGVTPQDEVRGRSAKGAPLADDDGAAPTAIAGGQKLDYAAPQARAPEAQEKSESYGAKGLETYGTTEAEVVAPLAEEPSIGTVLADESAEGGTEIAEVVEAPESDGEVTLLAMGSREALPVTTFDELEESADLAGVSGFVDVKMERVLGAQLKFPDGRVPPLVPHEEPRVAAETPPRLNAPAPIILADRPSGDVAGLLAASPPPAPAKVVASVAAPKAARKLAASEIRSEAKTAQNQPMPVTKAEPVPARVTKTVGKRAFELREGMWRQQGYAAQETTVLKRDSEALRALVAQHADLADVTELRGWIVFRVRNDWYKIPPAARAKTKGD
ncbi:MAG: hypothetical protein GY851_32365 [bacterium]|nr:hypothetical protein [bacterium]